jgi:hypothetical protein
MYISLGKTQIRMSHGILRLNNKSQYNSRMQSKPKMNTRECTGTEMSPEEQAELLKFPGKNSDIFVRQTRKL